ncbi:MAG: hypothetical protein VYB05_21340 [Pseudomonadota bacterium]|nr:hypothetical protein [Pseudomonadota bacterium]
MSNTANYNWPKPRTPGASQIIEIQRVANALDQADTKAKEISDALAALNAAYDAHTHAYGDLTGRPTTVAGFGITDAYTKTEIDTKVAADIDAAINALVNGSPGALDTLQELATAMGNDPNFATTVTNSLAGKLSKALNLADIVDQAAARSNLGLGSAATESTSSFASALQGINADNALPAANAGILSGHRNKIINGNFDIWQRGFSLGVGTGARYLADRWANFSAGSLMSANRQMLALGTPPLPEGVLFYKRIEVVSNAGANNHAILAQSIEDVRTLAGKRATLTFYARSDAPEMAVDFVQAFGTGGSPSGPVSGIGATKISLSPSWAKYSVVVDFPSIAGKVMGTNFDSFLKLHLWLDAGSAFDARTDGLGHQSGTFDIACVSLVEGDATAELDPSSPRHIQQELALCQRYCVNGNSGRDWLWAGAVSTGDRVSAPFFFPVPMRTVPTLSASVISSSGFNTTPVNLIVEGVRMAQISFDANASQSGAFIRGNYLAEAEYLS